jgi:hypothetical protein
MVEVAEIFRTHGPEYLAKYGERMPRAHLRAMRDIEQCRTPVLGGKGYVCTKCDEKRWSYHSCKNRHGPKCGNDQAEKWLEEQKELLLSVTHFLVTFTLPEELRAVARSNQKTVYSNLFRASSEALQKLAWDERFVGGRVGMVGVLHTWTRDQVKFATVIAEEFMRRFLQHVLPERFVKVRHYGLLSPGNRHLLKLAREALGARASGSGASSEHGVSAQREPLRCPSCGNEMKLIGTLSARGREPP